MNVEEHRCSEPGRPISSQRPANLKPPPPPEGGDLGRVLRWRRAATAPVP